MNTVRRFSLWILLCAATGCDGRVYRLSLHGDQIAKWNSAHYAEVSSVVEDVATRNGYEKHPVSDEERVRGIQAKFTADGQGYAHTGFSIVTLGNDRKDTLAIVVSVMVFPAFDYPAAKSVRTELSKKLVEKYGEKAVDGF